MTFTEWLLRRTWDVSSYRGDGDDALIGRLALHVLNDPAWPTFKGRGTRARYLDYLPVDLHEAFTVARERWVQERTVDELAAWRRRRLTHAFGDLIAAASTGEDVGA